MISAIVQNLSPGDFVRHSRQGPGRIVEVHPDFIEVKASAGHIFKVNKNLADFELQRYPADGFVALQVTKHLNSNSLLENIVDIAHRIFRDNLKNSLSQKDFRIELEPLIKRDGKSYAGWWKRARQKLIASGSVVVDPKKRVNLALTQELDSAAATDWQAEFSKATNGSDLLGFSKQLYASEVQEDLVSTLVAEGIDQAVNDLHTSDSDSRRFLESLLALVYLGSRSEGSLKEKCAEALEGIDFGSLPRVRELDEDVVIALGIVSRLDQKTAAEWANTLKDYPAFNVAKRAFNILNVERFRPYLKEPFLRWLHNEREANLTNLDLYLDDTFLRHIRREDRAALYIRISSRPEHSEAENRILADQAYIQLVGELNRMAPAAVVKSISRSSLNESSRLEMAKSLGHDRLLAEMLESYQPEYETYLPLVIEECEWSTLLSHSSKLVEVLRRPESQRSVAAFEKRFALSAQTLRGTDLLRATTLASELRFANPDHKPGVLERALQAAFSELLNSADELPPLSAAFSAGVQSLTAKLSEELKTATEALIQERALLKEAENDSNRLKNVVEFVKTSAKDERARIKFQALSDFISGILPVVDGLEEESTGEPEAVRGIFKALLAAFERSGLIRISFIGETVRFDPQTHRLIQETSASVETVKVVRSGYALRDTNGSTIIRPALVRPMEERTS